MQTGPASRRALLFAFGIVMGHVKNTTKGVMLRKIAIFAVLLAALALAAAAGAKTFKQSGQIVGDNVATVKLRVVTGKQGPKKVAGFKAKSVSARCQGGAGRINLTALQPIKVSAKTGSFRVLLVQSDGGGGKITIVGKVKKGGRATKGTVKTNTFETSEGQSCKVPKQKFKTAN